MPLRQTHNNNNNNNNRAWLGSWHFNRAKFSPFNCTLFLEDENNIGLNTAALMRTEPREIGTFEYRQRLQISERCRLTSNARFDMAFSF